jgi:hypothetical protein
MNPKTIKTLIKAFTPNKTKVDFSEFDSQYQKLKDSLKEKIQTKTLDDVNNQLEKYSKKTSEQVDKLNYEPLLEAFENLKQGIGENSGQLATALDEKIAEINNAIKENETKFTQGQETFSGEIKKELERLNADMTEVMARKVEIPDFGTQIKEAELRLMEMIKTAKEMDSLEDEKEKEEIQKQFASVETAIRKLRSEFQSRGGGSMNRNIAVGGNTSVLSKYTDINIKAGANVTLTYSNNNTTKYLDLTIASSGGGSVGGTVRSIQTLAVSSTIGTLAGTDQVYLANGGIRITLPTAVGDTNLYTIKNVGTSSVLIDTVSAQTIDAQATVIMPVRYTSVDIVSDNSNWNVT